jgi:hypothetical protein
MAQARSTTNEHLTRIFIGISVHRCGGGLVVGMQVADNPDGLNGVHASRGFGNGVVVTWLGGACEKKVTLTLAAAYAGYTVNIDTEPNFLVGGCSSVGIGRGVTITFRSPIAAEQITLR